MPTSRTPAAIVRREMRVAFSSRAQPVWFRVVKYGVLVVLAALFWRSPVFWWSLLGVLGVSLTLHVVWRWKTRGWTQPWLGWSDVDTANRE